MENRKGLAIQYFKITIVSLMVILSLVSCKKEDEFMDNFTSDVSIENSTIEDDESMDSSSAVKDTLKQILTEEECEFVLDMTDIITQAKSVEELSEVGLSASLLNKRLGFIKVDCIVNGLSGLCFVDSENGYVYDIFTVSNGNIVHLASGNEDSYYIIRDNDILRVYHPPLAEDGHMPAGSPDKSTTCFTVCKAVDNTLVDGDTLYERTPKNIKNGQAKDSGDFNFYKVENDKRISITSNDYFNVLYGNKSKANSIDLGYLNK